MAEGGRVLIAIPLYRSAELISDLFDSLIAVADEIRELPAKLLLINDSPDWAPLVAELDSQLPRLQEVIDVKVLVNDSNMGFVRSANRAFEVGIRSRADILLLNSDARPRPGALGEMKAVSALDPMIGFVSPRSNNATICNSPYPPAWRAASPDEAYRRHRAIERHLPRWSYVPTAVGFCLYVRGSMIDEFGFFDEIYGDGYNEENDLVRRCNRSGYRAVLANHAYVDHVGGASFAVSPVPRAEREQRNRAILIDRYPEYPLAVQRYYESPEYRAQFLSAGLVPLDSGQLRILFDGRTLASLHKGSFEHCRRLLEAFAGLAADRFDLFILCERAAFEFHELDAIEGLSFCEQEDIHDRPFAVAMRLVQPFLLEDVVTLADYAPITGFLVLDTIAMDCQQLDTHGLDLLWRFMAESASLIGYNSEFTRDQFRRRIDVWPHVVEFVSRCSTAITDYAAPVDESSPSERILIVGNDYPHKHVAETVSAIREKAPNACVATLGTSVETSDEAGPSGRLSAETVDAMYRDAGAVVFPSHYEGFGLPIMHALARQRPVIARDRPSAREIAERTEGAANLHLASSTTEIAQIAARIPRWQVSDPPLVRSEQSWRDAAEAMLNAIDTALACFDFTTCRRQMAGVAGHRARLDAERRYHDGIAATQRLQSELAATADDAHRHAETLADRLNDARREASLLRNEANSARWAASQERARRWEIRKHADRSEAAIAALIAGPRYQIAPASRCSNGNSLPYRIGSWFTELTNPSRIVARWADIAPPSPPKATSCLCLLLPPDLPPIPELAERTLRWLELLEVGGTLELRFSEAGNEQIARDASVLMQMLGCSPCRIRYRRGRTHLRGTKIWSARWEAAASLDNPLFLETAYRLILHREPDPAGWHAYTEAMTAGLSEGSVIRSLLTSRERFDLAAASLSSADAS